MSRPEVMEGKLCLQIGLDELAPYVSDAARQSLASRQPAGAVIGCVVFPATVEGLKDWTPGSPIEKPRVEVRLLRLGLDIVEIGKSHQDLSHLRHVGRIVALLFDHPLAVATDERGLGRAMHQSDACRVGKRHRGFPFSEWW